MFAPVFGGPTDRGTAKIARYLQGKVPFGMFATALQKCVCGPAQTAESAAHGSQRIDATPRSDVKEVTKRVPHVLTQEETDRQACRERRAACQQLGAVVSPG